jgi:hypothetical protein
MIFPTNPADGDTATFNNVVYQYYRNDRTWYAEGSNPNHVDPQFFQRRTYFQQEYDVVARFDEFLNIDRFVILRKKIEYYQGEIEKVLAEYRSTPAEKQALTPDREQYLMDLIAEIQDYINHPEPDSIIWPVFPV